MEPKRIKIFIADDDEAIVDATTMMLELSGHEVNSTLNGAEVISCLTAEYKPDLLILDIWMSGVDGRDICRLVRAEPRTANMGILMISASRDVKDSAIESGADDFLAKPFEMNDLLSRVTALSLSAEGKPTN